MERALFLLLTGLGFAVSMKMTMEKPLLTIGTRGSPLALAQAFETKRLLSESFRELADDGAIAIKKIMTKVLADLQAQSACNPN